jgi:hypothetical protein
MRGCRLPTKRVAVLQVNELPFSGLSRLTSDFSRSDSPSSAIVILRIMKVERAY